MSNLFLVIRVLGWICIFFIMLDIVVFICKLVNWWVSFIIISFCLVIFFLVVLSLKVRVLVVNLILVSVCLWVIFVCVKLFCVFLKLIWLIRWFWMDKDVCLFLCIVVLSLIFVKFVCLLSSNVWCLIFNCCLVRLLCKFVSISCFCFRLFCNLGELIMVIVFFILIKFLGVILSNI